MAILNFPNTGLVANVTQYTGDNGTTYTWDGVKWIGRSAGVISGTTNKLVNVLNEVILGSDGTITFPTKTTLDWDRSTLTGPTLQMGNDPTVSGAVITGPTPNLANPNAVRLIIQGQEGFALDQAAGAEGGDVYLWAGHGGEGDSYSGNGGNAELRGGVGGSGGYVRLGSGDAQAENGFGGFLDLSAGDAVVTGGIGGNVSIRAGNGTLSSGMVSILTNGQQWNFDTNGTLSSGGGSWTKTTNNYLANNVTTQVVWTASYGFMSGVKLTIQVECDETGTTNWHTQVCEAIIAVRGYSSSSEPVMSVYGVTHTSVAPLMTFSVQRNPTTFLIEIVGTRTATASPLGSADLRIYSVETGTND